MKADQASPLDKRIQQQGDIAIADENFRLPREGRKIEQRKETTGAIACPATKDSLNTRVSEHGGQLLSSGLIRPREEAGHVGALGLQPGLKIRTAEARDNPPPACSAWTAAAGETMPIRSPGLSPGGL